MKSKIKKNTKQQLYVIPSGKGFTCLGFDVCINRINKLSIEMELPVQPVKRGTLQAYSVYNTILNKARQRNIATGWRSQIDLIPEFIGKEGKRVEIIDCNGEKRRFYIGRSTGWIPCHLEISKINSTGGGCVTGYPFQKLTFLY